MFVRYLLKTLALPPAINILVILFALVFIRRQGLKKTIIVLSILSLAVLAMPVCTQYLAKQLENHEALNIQELNPAHYQAIVILGAGRQREAPEYGRDVPSLLGLERLRYGAMLHKKTGLPILVSGGKWSLDETPETDFMRQILEQEFGVKIQWQERKSRTTWENAQYSREIAIASEIKSILLVTHAWHMPRAFYSFKKAGFSVTPAPLGFKTGVSEQPDLLDYIPQAKALSATTLLLHEWLGMVWYRLTYD